MNWWSTEYRGSVVTSFENPVACGHEWGRGPEVSKNKGECVVARGIRCRQPWRQRSTSK